jgi:hypothetical protein
MKFRGSCISRTTQRPGIGTCIKITPRSEYTGASWHRISCPSICLSEFALEYIRQIINSDDIHFVSLKKKQQLRIKGQIGSFICNNRGAGEEADRMLREMKFFMSFPWHYDPCGIISEMRVKNKNIPYVHVSRPEVEKFANQTAWEPNTLIEVEQQDPPATVSQTTTPQVPKEKRPRQDLSPPVTEVSSEEFQLHTKRPKTCQSLARPGKKKPRLPQ